jgi:hypothetical protein
MAIRTVLSLGLLALEAALFVRARRGKTRRFGGSPYDEITEYEILLWEESGAPVSPRRIKELLQIPAAGRYNRCPGDVLDLVETWIQRHGAGYRASIRYHVHGGPEQVWSCKGASR